MASDRTDKTRIGSDRTHKTWGAFLETPHNFSGPKNILGVQYSRIATTFLSFLKLNFNIYNFFKHIAKFALIIAIS